MAALTPEEMELYRQFEGKEAEELRISLTSLPCDSLAPYFRDLAGESGAEALVCDPRVVFYHYGVNGERDHSWGCSYRCAQMIESCWQNPHEAEAVSSVADIQKHLGDIEVIPMSDVGTHRWIEPPQVKSYLDSKSFGNANEAIEVSVANEEQVALLRSRLLDHFAEPDALPVMVDDKTCSYIIAGVARSTDDDLAVLVLDPHYTHPHQLDDLKRLVQEHRSAEKSALPVARIVDETMAAVGLTVNPGNSSIREKLNSLESQCGLEPAAGATLKARAVAIADDIGWSPHCWDNSGGFSHPVGWISFESHFKLTGPRIAEKTWMVLWPHR